MSCTQKVTESGRFYVSSARARAVSKREEDMEKIYQRQRKTRLQKNLESIQYADVPNKVGFVCRVGGDGECKGRTHIWTGEDSVCRMYSTGGLRASKYEYFIEPPTKICLNCLRHPDYLGHE